MFSKQFTLHSLGLVSLHSVAIHYFPYFLFRAVRCYDCPTVIVATKKTVDQGTTEAANSDPMNYKSEGDFSSVI